MHKKIPRIFCPRISRIFVQASAEPNLFGLCRVQPKMSKKSTRISCFAFNGDLFGRTNRTNAMREHRGRSCGVVPSRHIGLASPFRGLRPRLPSLRSVVPSRHSSSPKSINVSDFCDDNRDNLGQLEVVFCGRNKQRMNYCPRIARIDTKAMR